MLYKKGSKGAAVISIKQRLFDLGYLPKAPTHDRFGSDTDKAVRKFQAVMGLVADGVVGPLTLAALEGAQSGNAEAEPAPQGLIADFLAYLKAQVGSIYVWGGQGEAVTSAKWIEQKETSVYNAARAIRLYNRRKAEGMDPILAYDCSGLIVRFLLDKGLYTYDMAARHLYTKCQVLSRDALRPGDLVFRHNGVRIYHVGAYMGGGMVIESKGRDDGVVYRSIDASGSQYWNRYGRLAKLAN